MLIAVAAVGVVAVVMLLWWTAGLIFGWRFQFGIRSVLAFCLACSVVVSWFAVEWKDARRQADMVEWMKGSGVSANYDWDAMRTTNLITNRRAAGTTLAAESGGCGFLLSGCCDHSGTKITDAELEQLKGLTQLRELVTQPLNQDHRRGAVTPQRTCLTHITDVGLKYVSGFSQLQSLNLSGTRITVSGWITSKV